MSKRDCHRERGWDSWEGKGVEGMTACLSGFDERGNAFHVGCGSIQLMGQVLF